MQPLLTAACRMLPPSGGERIAVRAVRSFGQPRRGLFCRPDVRREFIAP